MASVPAKKKHLLHTSRFAVPLTIMFIYIRVCRGSQCALHVQYPPSTPGEMRPMQTRMVSFRNSPKVVEMACSWPPFPANCLLKWSKSGGLTQTWQKIRTSSKQPLVFPLLPCQTKKPLHCLHASSVIRALNGLSGQRQNKVRVGEVWFCIRLVSELEKKSRISFRPT